MFLLLILLRDTIGMAFGISYLPALLVLPAIRFFRLAHAEHHEARLAEPARHPRAQARRLMSQSGAWRSKLLLAKGAWLFCAAAAFFALVSGVLARLGNDRLILFATSLMFALPALAFYRYARAHREMPEAYRREADIWRQGVEGEERVAAELGEPPPGWQYLFGVEHEGLGDIDLVVITPWGVAFAVEIKSHKGLIFIDGEPGEEVVCLRDRYFDKDFIWQALRGAGAERNTGRYREVIPVLCFSHAKIARQTPPWVRGVRVLSADRLRAFLFEEPGSPSP